MSAGLTAEDVRRIVREENLRLLRVLLLVADRSQWGYAGATEALDAIGLPGGGGDAMRQAVIDYREGR